MRWGSQIFITTKLKWSCWLQDCASAGLGGNGCKSCGRSLVQTSTPGCSRYNTLFHDSPWPVEALKSLLLTSWYLRRKLTISVCVHARAHAHTNIHIICCMLLTFSPHHPPYPGWPTNQCVAFPKVGVRLIAHVSPPPEWTKCAVCIPKMTEQSWTTPH